MRQRFCIIRNPRSGWWGRRHYDIALNQLRQSGALIEIIETTAFSQGRQQAAKAALASEAGSKKFDAVVAAGGDGTIHDVASGLIGTDTPLGIIPMGTGNVFATELNIERKGAALAKMLLHGKVVDMPVGLIGDQPFLFVIGVGFDAEAVRNFEKASARHLGRAGFVMPVLRALLSNHTSDLTITTPQKLVNAHWAIVTRVKHYAAGFMLAPGGDPFAQEFHVVCFKGKGAMIRARQMAALATGLAGHDRSIEIIKTTRALIEGDATTAVQIDGEVMGRLPLTITTHPKTLPIILPEFP